MRVTIEHLVVVCLCCVTVLVSAQNHTVVETPSGRIRGTCGCSGTNKGVCEFLGIPFAKPPIGDLRFKHPQPLNAPRNDSTIYNATEQQNACFQTLDTSSGGFPGTSMFNPRTNLSEDCLYLNVWTPQEAYKRAVMVFIHGGQFSTGSINRYMFNASLLASENDVVVVTVAYRVGVFGFFYLDHPEAPGNAGLFDQLMGLQWVQQNIESFGGDPGNVTLFGHSAGGFSVGLHLLSLPSADLFHRAILQSGTPLLPGLLLSSSDGKSNSRNLALKVAGCSKSDDMAMIASCMKNLPADVLQSEMSKSRIQILPTIDGNFITADPAEFLKTGKFKKCSIMIGSVLNDGSYIVIKSLPQYLNLTFATMTRAQFLDSLKSFELVNEDSLPSASKKLVDESLAFQYTDWLNPEDTYSNLASLSFAYGDVIFVYPNFEFADAYASQGQSVYSYQLTERYNRNPWPAWMGVVHSDDVFFVLGAAPYPGLDLSDKDKELSRAIMSYWTSFAKSGNPNEIVDANVTRLGDWPTYNTSSRAYLELNSQYLGETMDTRAVHLGLRIKECAYWKYFMPSLLNVSSSTPTSGGAAIRLSTFTCVHNLFVVLLVLCLLNQC